MDQVKALFDYAAAYKQNLKNGIVQPFSTSWSTYSLCTTQEEQLICDLQETLVEKDGSGEVWFEKFVPHALVVACVELGATDEQVKSVGEFIKDMMIDLILCHQQEAE